MSARRYFRILLTGDLAAGYYFSSEDFESEVLIAYEAGYRQVVNEKVSYDIALYYNDYDKLKTAEPVAISTPPHHWGISIFIHMCQTTNSADTAGVANWL